MRLSTSPGCTANTPDYNRWHFVPNHEKLREWVEDARADPETIVLAWVGMELRGRSIALPPRPGVRPGGEVEADEQQ